MVLLSKALPAKSRIQLLNDICIMTEGQRPSFLTTGFLAQNFGFELLESVLTHHADTVTAHPEQIQILRLRLMPLMLKIMSEKAPFAVTVRVMRLLQLLVSRMLFVLAAECEVALGLLNGMLDPTTHLWKRALALEVFGNFHANPSLVRSIYEYFDEISDRRNIVRDHLGILVRLAAEKPATIGVGLQLSSTYRPNDDSGDQCGFQAGGVVGSVVSTAGIPETEGVGISTRWSMMRTPCIDLIDKADAPNVPVTYVYALALTCINNFSDGLAKFLLPLTTPSETKLKRKERTTQEGEDPPTEAREKGVHQSQSLEGTSSSTSRRSMRSRKQSINPLSLEDHELYRQIRTSAHMVENCWPALLAACSTFLNAALDTDYYHALIRSFQRLTQVAGLLEFSTPRDALLTTLGKNAIPASRGISNKIRKSLDHGSRGDTIDESDRDSSPAPSLSSPRPKNSLDLGSPSITSRNLLCLRALLNLGIALGPSLKQSWSIILETLQQAELLLPQTDTARTRSQFSRQSSRAQINQTDPEAIANGEDFVLEVAAATTAAARMIESTSDYSDDAFLVFMQCLCNLFHLASSDHDKSVADSANPLLSPQTPSRKHQRFPSVAERAPGGHVRQGNLFALDKLHDLIQCNISRLSKAQRENPGWDLLTGELITVLSTQAEHSSVRVKATETFNNLMIAVTTFTVPEPEAQDFLRTRALGAIKDAIAAIYKQDRAGLKGSQNCDDEIHRLLLEAVRAILEHCGDSLVSGWRTVFNILMTTFDTSVAAGGIERIDLSILRTSSAKLVRSSFGSLQLICSDYLQSVPLSCLPMLIDTLYFFCSQALDFNISLTVSPWISNSCWPFH